MNTYAVLVNHKKVAEIEEESIEDAEAEVEIKRIKIKEL